MHNPELSPTILEEAATNALAEAQRPPTNFEPTEESVIEKELEPRNGPPPYLEPEDNMATFEDANDKGTSLAKKFIKFCGYQAATWNAYYVNVERMLSTKHEVEVKLGENEHIILRTQQGRERNNGQLLKEAAAREAAREAAKLVIESQLSGDNRSYVEDSALIEERKRDNKGIVSKMCFLCPKKKVNDNGDIVDNLEDKQRGLFYRGRALILTNLFPIIEKCHLTIPIEHTPQLWDKVSETAFLLAGDLSSEDGEDWVIFYNGGRVGASAADHGHLQAGIGRLPVQDDAEKVWGKRLLETDSVAIIDDLSFADVGAFVPKQLSRSVLVLSGNNPDSVRGALREAINRLPLPEKEMSNGDRVKLEEPDMNIIISCKTGIDNKKTYYAYMFPRKEFRAKNYSGEENEKDESKYAVGCAALEMAGKMLLTLKKDWDKLVDPDGKVDIDKAKGVIKSIYANVSIPIGTLIQQLTNKTNVQ